MPDQTVDNAFGIVPKATTHWGISKRPHKGASERLSYPDENAVHRQDWPLLNDDGTPFLTMDLVRDRWGAGTFRVHWIADEDGKVSPVGQGRIFSLEAQTVAKVPGPPPVAASTDGMTADLFLRVLEMADRRARDQVESISRLAGIGGERAPASSGENSAIAELQSELASMRAEMQARDERERLREQHREELAAKDRRIAELERDLERDEPASSAPSFVPGEPIAGQIGAAIATMLFSKPELIAAIAAPIVAKFSTPSSPPPPSLPAHTAPLMPRPMPEPTLSPNGASYPMREVPTQVPPSVNNAMPQVPIAQAQPVAPKPPMVPVVHANGQPVHR